MRSRFSRDFSNRIRRGGLLLVFLAGAFQVFGCSPPPARQVAPEAPTPVTIRVLNAHDLPVVVEGVGRLAANRDVTLAAEVGGVVEDFFFDVGDPVAEGRAMARIDPTDYRLAAADAQAGLDAARAQVAAAASSYERARNLLPKNVIPNDSFERIEAEYLAAKAAAARARVQLDLARERLAKTEIKAPFSGLVAARMVELGQMLSPGSPVMQLLDSRRMKVRLNVAENDYALLDPADPVEILVEAYPDKKFSGRIDRLGVKADPFTNTFSVEILIENKELILKDGLTARVRVTARVIEGAVLIPQSAILFREGGQEVFVAGPGDRAELREITLGRVQGADIQVVSGLKPGDRLVTVGASYVKEGGAMTVSSPDAVQP
ncbi:MAG: efflux RND transporter periplasmic adaptor subunit [Pseudomonadota bacterium]